MRQDLSQYLPKRAIDTPISYRRLRQNAIWLIGGLAALAILVAVLPGLVSARYLADGQAALARESGATGPDRAAGAIASFQRALSWSPSNPNIYRALAQAYLRQGQPQQAVGALEQAYRLRPEGLLIRQELAQAYEAAGQVQQADAMWRSLGVGENDLIALGEQARRVKQYAEALAWYERAARAAPESGQPLYYAGLAYNDAQQWDKAARALDQASRRSPQNRDIWYALGQALRARGERARALAAFQQGFEGREGGAGQSNLLFQIGYTRQYPRAASDPAAAWAAYEQALALDEYRVDAWQKAETYYQRGVLLTWQNRWAQAIEEYQQSLAANPQRYAPHIALAEALGRLGRREDAVAQARQAIAIDPRRKNAYQFLGDLYASEHNKADASAMYTRVLELDPQDRQAQKALEALR
jgi:tetratricopeptide (TPR) repeat protein